jgi:hypothetical protein
VKVPIINADDAKLAQAARDALDEVLARDPLCILIVYETHKQFGYASIPASAAMVHGLYMHLGGLLMPPGE